MNSEKIQGKILMERKVEETEWEVKAGNGYYWVDHSSPILVVAKTLASGLSEIERYLR